MARLVGLAGTAGLVLACTVAVATAAEICPSKRPVETISPVIPAAQIAPLPERPVRTQDCVESEEARSPDAVCVYRPGMENERTAPRPASSPQISSEGPERGLLGTLSDFAAHMWSAAASAFAFLIGAQA